MTTLTYKAKFIVSTTDGCGYTNLVFERFNYSSSEEQYVMCVKYPNWNQASFKTGDVGFLTVRYVKAGEDTWFDGTQHVPYKYTDVAFLKFIPIKEEVECITLD